MSKFCNKQINPYYNINNLQNSQAALRLGTVNLGTRTNFSINTIETSEKFQLRMFIQTSPGDAAERISNTKPSFYQR